MFDVYKPSGGIGPLTYPLMIGGIVVAVALAFVYQLALEYIPLIYLCFLITGAMGMGLAMLASFIVNVGHCRNLMVAAIIGLVLATCGLGAKYWFQYQRIVKNQVAFEMDQPNVTEADREAVQKFVGENLTFMKHIEFRAATGWNVGRGGGAPVSGFLVYLVWLIEAGIIYYFALTIPVSAAGEPYSEKTSKWADEAENVMSLPVTEDEMVAKIKSASTVDELLEIPIPKTDMSNQFAMYTVNSIPGQELEDAYLTVELTTFSVNNKGEEVTTSESLVKHAVLSSEKRKQLVDNAELLQEALEDYRASVEEEAAQEAEAEQNSEVPPEQEEGDA